MADELKTIELSEEHQMRFDFYKHLSTLALASAAFTVTLLDKSLIAKSGAGRYAVLCFILDGLLAFGQMYFLSHTTLPLDPHERFDKSNLGQASKALAILCGVVYVLACVFLYKSLE